MALFPTALFNDLLSEGGRDGRNERQGKLWKDAYLPKDCVFQSLYSCLSESSKTALDLLALQVHDRSESELYLCF